MIHYTDIEELSGDGWSTAAVNNKLRQEDKVLIFIKAERKAGYTEGTFEDTLCYIIGKPIGESVTIVQK